VQADAWKHAEDLFERGLHAGEAERDRLLTGVPGDVAAMVRDLWRQHAGRLVPEHPVAALDQPRQFSDGQAPTAASIAGFNGAAAWAKLSRPRRASGPQRSHQSVTRP
jgi:hypothetical protein